MHIVEKYNKKYTNPTSGSLLPSIEYGNNKMHCNSSKPKTN